MELLLYSPFFWHVVIVRLFVREKYGWFVYIFQFLLLTWDILPFLYQNHWMKPYLQTEWPIWEMYFFPCLCWWRSERFADWVSLRGDWYANRYQCINVRSGGQSGICAPLLQRCLTGFCKRNGKNISSIFAKLEVESRNELLAKMKSFASDSKG